MLPLIWTEIPISVLVLGGFQAIILFAISPFKNKTSRIFDQTGASEVALAVKNLLANAGDTTDVNSVPGSGRSPGGGDGNALQYSCQRNPMDRGAWRATVHRVAKSWTQD